MSNLTEHRAARAINASYRIGELSALARQVELDLRDGAPDAYARVYWLRRELGYVANELGVGLPDHAALRRVEAEYTALVVDADVHVHDAGEYRDPATGEPVTTEQEAWSFVSTEERS